MRSASEPAPTRRTCIIGEYAHNFGGASLRAPPFALAYLRAADAYSNLNGGFGIASMRATSSVRTGLSLSFRYISCNGMQKSPSATSSTRQKGLMPSGIHAPKFDPTTSTMSPRPAHRANSSGMPEQRHERVLGVKPWRSHASSI